MKRFSTTQTQTLRAGFSLVEVVLALGLFAFAFVPLLGLVPVSLASAKQATEINRMSKITQKVAAELSQDKFANVRALIDKDPEWFFDYDGNEVGAGDSERHFTVEALVRDSPVAGQTADSLLRVHLKCSTPSEEEASSATITICDMGY